MTTHTQWLYYLRAIKIILNLVDGLNQWFSNFGGPELLFRDSQTPVAPYLKKGVNTLKQSLISSFSTQPYALNHFETVAGYLPEGH